MPYAIRYRPGDRLAVIEYSGHIIGGEVAESIETLAERVPAASGPLSVLCDTRAATSIFALSGDVERAVKALKKLERAAPEGRGAYLGGHNHAVFIGLVRIVLKLVGSSSRRERRVFTDHDEAMLWLAETVPPMPGR